MLPHFYSKNIIKFEDNTHCFVFFWKAVLKIFTEIFHKYKMNKLFMLKPYFSEIRIDNRYEGKMLLKLRIKI